MLGMAKRFADYATKSVTGDGIADDFRADRQAEARLPNIIGPHYQRKAGVAVAATLTVSRFEIEFAQDPTRGRKPETTVLGLG